MRTMPKKMVQVFLPLYVLVCLFVTTGFGTSQINEELVSAAKQGDLIKVKRLIASGINLNATDQRGITALGMAALYEHIDVLDFLLSQGADPNVKFNNGDTALIFAAIKDKSEILEKLLQAGADINAQSNNGYTALFNAAMLSKTGNIDILVKAGANLEARENEDQRTALFIARNSPEAVVALLERGADINARDKSGYTPLMIAAKQGFIRSVQVLLRRGADTTVKSNDGYTALMLAQEYRHRKIFKLIQEAMTTRVGRTR